MHGNETEVGKVVVNGGGGGGGGGGASAVKSAHADADATLAMLDKPDKPDKPKGGKGGAVNKSFAERLDDVGDGTLDKLTGKGSLMALWGAACVEHCPCEWDDRPCGFKPLFGKCDLAKCPVCASKTALPANTEEIKTSLKSKMVKHWADKFSA